MDLGQRHSCTTQLLELMEDFTNFYEMEIPFDVFIWTLQRPLIEFLIKDY